MKKTILFAAAILTTLSLSASPLKGWFVIQQNVIKKNPTALKHAAKTTTMNGVKGAKWRIFRASNPINAAKGQNLEITLKASGKGKIDIGCYEYVEKYTSTDYNVKKIAIPAKLTTQKIIIPIRSARTKIVRPAFEVQPDSQIVIHDISFKVVPAAKK